MWQVLLRKSCKLFIFVRVKDFVVVSCLESIWLNSWYTLMAKLVCISWLDKGKPYLSMKADIMGIHWKCLQVNSSRSCHISYSQISHCEIKSHRISHKEGSSHKKIQFSLIFRPFYNRFYEEININHTLLWFSQTSYMQRKTLDHIWGAPKWFLREPHRILSSLP